jgi:mannose-6-phosphate isomerase-like protein (cupin superfamily)
MADEQVQETVNGDGWAAANVDAMGEGPGFRKVRRVLDVTAFGVNAVVLPEGIESGFHYHDEQQELYFVHQGEVEFEFGDGRKVLLGPGGFVRVDAATHRKMRNAGSGDAIYVSVGGKDGYVGRDAHVPEGDSRVRG